MDLAYPSLVADVLPAYLGGFFLAVLLGAVFSSFNSLLNSAATLFCLDVYQPMLKREISDQQLIRVAKIASVVIALFSFAAAPLLQYAPEGLWQIIRIFTGFYNIPVITLVLVGLFTKHVPALAAKVAVIFHVVAYGLLQFAFDVQINFIHIYAILFFIEVGIMLYIGRVRPTEKPWQYTARNVVDMTPWRFAVPTSIILFACIIATYLLFSPIGLVGGLSAGFWMWLLTTVVIAAGLCGWSERRWRQVHAAV